MSSAGVANFNGDGILDIAVVDVNSGQAAILPGNGDGTFRAPNCDSLDKNGATMQKWDFALVPQSSAPQWRSAFCFRTKPSSTEFLLPPAQIKGNYMLSVLGGAQTAAADLTIHAEKTVVGGNSRLCSAN